MEEKNINKNEFLLNKVDFGFLFKEIFCLIC